MGLKSSFLPSNALQGEDIPSFILWEDVDYDRIEIIKNECCTLKEIYNVKEGEYEVYTNKIIINSVEVEGYLGLLFKSTRTDDVLLQTEISYVFIKDDIVIIRSNHEIVLFRPEIEVKYMPKEIIVEEGKIKSNKIMLQNIGEGTCQLVFKTSDDSEIKITKPKRYREFLDGFTNTFNEEVEHVKDKYLGYEYVFDDLYHLANTLFDPSNKELMDDIGLRIDRIDDAMEENENLYKDIIRIISMSLLKNISIITVMEQLLEYLRSIEKNRVKIINSLDSIIVQKGEQIIELELHYTDLLFSIIPPIKLNKIKIISDSESDLSIYSLFNWAEGL